MYYRTCFLFLALSCIFTFLIWCMAPVFIHNGQFSIFKIQTCSFCNDIVAEKEIFLIDQFCPERSNKKRFNFLRINNETISLIHFIFCISLNTFVTYIAPTNKKLRRVSTFLGHPVYRWWVWAFFSEALSDILKFEHALTQKMLCQQSAKPPASDTEGVENCS